MIVLDFEIDADGECCSRAGGRAISRSARQAILFSGNSSSQIVAEAYLRDCMLPATDLRMSGELQPASTIRAGWVGCVHVRESGRSGADRRHAAQHAGRRASIRCWWTQLGSGCWLTDQDPYEIIAIPMVVVCNFQSRSLWKPGLCLRLHCSSDSPAAAGTEARGRQGA